MPEPDTDTDVWEKLKKANDNWHKAVDDVLKNELEVATKAQFATEVHRSFTAMSHAKEIIRPHYEP